jgi:hypothetical protein
VETHILLSHWLSHYGIHYKKQLFKLLSQILHAWSLPSLSLIRVQNPSLALSAHDIWSPGYNWKPGIYSFVFPQESSISVVSCWFTLDIPELEPSAGPAPWWWVWFQYGDKKLWLALLFWYMTEWENKFKSIECNKNKLQMFFQILRKKALLCIPRNQTGNRDIQISL